MAFRPNSGRTPGQALVRLVLILIAAALGVPALLYGLFVLAVVILQPSFR